MFLWQNVWFLHTHHPYRRILKYFSSWMSLFRYLSSVKTKVFREYSAFLVQTNVSQWWKCMFYTYCRCRRIFLWEKVVFLTYRWYRGMLFLRFLSPVTMSVVSMSILHTKRRYSRMFPRVLCVVFVFVLFFFTYRR